MTQAGKATHLLTGKMGEDAAAAFMRGKGMKILERNWRPESSIRRGASSLELDIIARDKGCIVFVEVKTRHLKPGSAFSPLDAFGKAKQNNLLKAATLYLEDRRLWSEPCRFDLICVVISPDNSISMESHENVISFENAGRGTMGNGNAAWQPW